MSNRVLSRADQDKVDAERLRFVRFPEFDECPPGGMMISIEHCTHCEAHATSTKHNQEKYRAFAENL